MSYEEILETSADGKFRVKLIQDEWPDEPYDDGQSPLLRLDTGSYGNVIRAEHIMATGRPTDDDERIEEAACRWGSPSGDDFALFEKYLRTYYGTREIETWYSGSYWYVTYDTAAWQKYIGFEDDAEAPDHLVNMDEYRAWCEGEVFGFVVEKNELWHKDSNPGETMESWEIEDSCWGFYGDIDYTRSSALDALAYAVKSDIPVPVPFWTRVVQRVQRIFRMKS